MGRPVPGRPGQALTAKEAEEEYRKDLAAREENPRRWGLQHVMIGRKRFGVPAHMKLSQVERALAAGDFGPFNPEANQVAQAISQLQENNTLLTRLVAKLSGGGANTAPGAKRK